MLIVILFEVFVSSRRGHVAHSFESIPDKCRKQVLLLQRRQNNPLGSKDQHIHTQIHTQTPHHHHEHQATELIFPITANFQISS